MPNYHDMYSNECHPRGDLISAFNPPQSLVNAGVVQREELGDD